VNHRFTGEHEGKVLFDWPRALIQFGVTGLPQPFSDVAAQPVRR
jgi:hypothetical protein